MVDDSGDLDRPRAPTRREHVQALLLALACAVLFLRDGLLPGRALVPHPPELFDVVMEQARADGTLDLQDAFRGNVGMTDKYLQSLCWDRVIQDRLRAGELPRWTRDIGGGAPFVPQMAQPFQPINLLLLLIPSAEWYGWWYLTHLVLFGWFAYAFVRRIGCLHGAGLLALVAATLGMWTQCKLHHNVILTAALSLWPMLSATHELIARGARDRGRRAAVGWLALWTGLSWSTGFVVIALQATYLAGAFALFCAARAPRGERLRRLAPFAVGLALGGALSLANMLPVLTAATESARQGQFDADRLAALSLEHTQLLAAIWPDLLCWPADRFYEDAAGGYFTRMPLSQLLLLERPLREDGTAFQNWVETSFSIGLLPLTAAICALFARRNLSTAWFFALFAAAAFCMATATEPLFSLAKLLPGITAGDLRRLLFLVAMPMVVLSGLGADAWLRRERLVPAKMALGAVAAASSCALLWLLSRGNGEPFLRGLAELFVLDADNPSVIQAGGDAELVASSVRAELAPRELPNNHRALCITFGASLAAALVGLLALWRVRATSLLVLLATTVTELLVLGVGPVQTIAADRLHEVPRVLEPIAAEHDEGMPRPRLQRLVPPGARPSAGLPGNLPGFLGFADANAYNPLPPARFEEYFNNIEAGVSHAGAGVGAFRDAASLTHPLCDLYGVRYVVSRVAPANVRIAAITASLAKLRGPGLGAALACFAEASAAAAIVDRTPADTGAYHLLERLTAMPRATFVRGVDVVTDPTARLAALASRDRDVRARVMLEDPSAPTPRPAERADAEVKVTLHDDERVELLVRTSHDGYVRLADPYDAGWRVAVDGANAPLYVADHYLRAVYVEAGEHRLVFTYDGARVVWPLRLSLVALLAVLAALWTGRRSR